MYQRFSPVLLTCTTIMLHFPKKNQATTVINRTAVYLRIYCTEKVSVSPPERRPVLLYKDVCIRDMKVDVFNPIVREPDAAAGSLMSELTFTQVRRGERANEKIAQTVEEGIGKHRIRHGFYIRQLQPSLPFQLRQIQPQQALQLNRKLGQLRAQAPFSEGCQCLQSVEHLLKRYKCCDKNSKK